MKTQFPGWMLAFHGTHGVWPIAGGSSTEPPPAQPAGDGIEVTENSPPPAPPLEHAPSAPASTYSVDPATFTRGTQEAPGQTPPAQPAAPTTPSGRVFTEEDVTRIRQEEKDKVYGRVEELTTEIKALREDREDEQRAKAEEEARAEEAARKAGESDLDVRELLTKKEQEWNDRFRKVEQEREQDRALLEKERQFNAIQEYKRNILTQHEDEIMPELRDLVDGNSEEEIQASVQRAIEKTNGIMGNIQAAQQQSMQQVPTSRITQPGDGGPLESTEGGSRTYTPEEIRGMSMAEYAKRRPDFLAAAGRQYKGGR